MKLAPVPPWPYREGMDRARQTWVLTQQLLADDPELDPAVLAMAHLGAAAVLFEQCDPEMPDAILAAVGSVIGASAAQRS